MTQLTSLVDVLPTLLLGVAERYADILFHSFNVGEGLCRRWLEYFCHVTFLSEGGNNTFFHEGCPPDG